MPKPKKFTVHLMTAYCTWEGVEAKNENDAINQCHTPDEFDGNDPHTWIANEEEEEEDDEEEDDE